MRLLICGDREWTDPAPIHAILESFLGRTMGGQTRQEDFILIEGCARGADRIACKWHEQDRFVEHEHFPAEWTKYGKAAGPIRNRLMLTEGKPELVVAFHDDIATSKGTKDMVTIAKKAGVPTWIIKHA